ncbi:MarR family transcriptional regulator [Amycolatopsis coloradensis]|uniref:MarR family transcriptional regulator n=1 Tax=Amycolatopsis coloradensis TaxID=76021 RepID=UPI0031342366
MVALKTRRVASQRELAVGVRGATLTYHLNAMESTGRITRQRDPRTTGGCMSWNSPTRVKRSSHWLTKAAIAHDNGLRRVRRGGDHHTGRAAAANGTGGGIDQENSDWTHPNGDSGQD